MIRCGFCYDREQGTHGEVKREWSPEWLQFIAVCRVHALYDGMDGHDQRQLIPVRQTTAQLAQIASAAPLTPDQLDRLQAKREGKI